MRLNKKEHNELKTKGAFGEIERKSRIVFIADPIDKDLAAKVNKTLLLYDEISNDPIKIFINSPGGEVYSGFFIYDCIRFLNSPVYIIGAGLVASAAALIYLAVDKEYRYCLPHTRFLLHQPLSGMRGTVSDLEIHAKELDNIKKLISDIIATQTTQDISKVGIDIDRDYWLHAYDALEYGLVYQIIQNKEDVPLLFPTDKAKKKDSIKKDSKSNTKSTKKITVSKSSVKKTTSKKE